MVRGGAPCVLDCYLDYFRQFIRNNELRDLFIFDPAAGNDSSRPQCPENHPTRLARPHARRPLRRDGAGCSGVRGRGGRGRGCGGAAAVLKACWERNVNGQPSLKTLTAASGTARRRGEGYPASAIRNAAPRWLLSAISSCGFSPSFMEGVHQRYAPTASSWCRWASTNFSSMALIPGMASTARGWNLPPDSAWSRRPGLPAFLCNRPPGLPDTNWAEYHWLKSYDESYRRLFARTGLLIGAGHDIAHLFAQAAEHLSPTLAGEASPPSAKASPRRRKATTASSPSAPSTACRSAFPRPS